MTDWYCARHDWHDASGDHTVTVTVRPAPADARTDPRATDRDCVLVRWYRAGRTAVAFGDHAVDDWVNPDDYWPDGKLMSWHAALVIRFGRTAVACFVTDTGDRLVAHPAFHLGDLTTTVYAIDAHGATADGLAVISPGTGADPADWPRSVAACEADLHTAVARMDAWCRDRLLELVRTSDTDPDERCVTVYDGDMDWAVTRAKCWARNYARGYDTT